MNQYILNKLKKSQEMINDEYDGSYELTRAIVNAYQRVKPSLLDDSDVQAIFYMASGRYKHNENIDEVFKPCHISQESKQDMNNLLETIARKSSNGMYDNKTIEHYPMMDMFDSGIYHIKKKINKKLSRSFIQMCIDISTKTDDNEMFLHIEPVLAELNQVMRASTASIILHCLKPYTFPILNNNIGYEDVYKALDIQLMRKSNVDTYIQNCRKIKEFRDANLPFRNYQIFYLENRKLRENFNPIVEIISKYKADFVIRDKEEGYKWGAIKCFQDNWDIDADDFAGMLERALAKTSNLLASQAIKKGISHDRLEHYQIQ